MIWCVEDDASIRDIEVYTLTSTGFEARGFDDGVSFWSALQTQKPDLVVLDVMLPGVDGIELLQRMKASAELRTIPVVMATAKGAEYDKIRGLDLGADYYLVKPFGVMELVSCVKAVLRRHRDILSKSAAPLYTDAAVLDPGSFGGGRDHQTKGSGVRGGNSVPGQCADGLQFSHPLPLQMRAVHKRRPGDAPQRETTDKQSCNG